MATVKLSADTEGLANTLAALADATNRLPEFGERLLGLINSGDELFRLNCDDLPAAGTSEFVVRFYPSDALASLVAAFGARDCNGFLFEHGASPVEPANHTTTYEAAQ